MPKRTNRDLILAVAKEIGGEQGKRMIEALSPEVFAGSRSFATEFNDEEFESLYITFTTQFSSGAGNFAGQALVPMRSWGDRNYEFNSLQSENFRVVSNTLAPRSSLITS